MINKFNLILKIVKKINYQVKTHILIDKYDSQYISHNLKKWGKYSVGKNKEKGVILVDLFAKNSLIHFWSYLVNILAKKTNSKIEYFYISLYKSKLLDYKISIRRLVKLFQSFNVTKGISQHDFKYSKGEIRLFEKKFYALKFDKKKLIKFKIENIKIGDLISDTYMRAHLSSTVNMEDESLKKIFFKAIKFYYVSKSYFNKNKVVAVIPSHTCYLYGIISRIAASKNIPIIKVNSDNRGNENFRINIVDRKFVNEEAAPYFNFKKEFRKLTTKKQREGLKIGKKIIDNRLSGNYDETLPYMKISQFNKNFKSSNLILKNKKKKIFIFPHCFFDNVHRFRKMLFTDFHDQINFLLNLSKKYDKYEWYYKPHVHELKSEFNKHIEILKNFPNVILLKPKLGHCEIIKSKPHCIITNHGSVGHEYARFKIPVIFTGDNKHINYKFAYHANSKSDIENVIKNNKILRKKIRFNLNELYEFIFMNYFYFQNLYDRKLLIKDTFFNSKNRSIWDTPAILRHIIKLSDDNDKFIEKYINNLINSKDLKRYFS